MQHSVAVVVGTRPEAIKLLGVLRRLGPRARIIHTGQHYDDAMWAHVLADLPGVQVHEHLEVGGRTSGEQLGRGTELLARSLAAEPAQVLVVQGDTTSTLAGALAGNAAGVPVVHVEAGLRSHDRSMPEEINRVLVDSVADLCCAPTPANAEQLRREGVAAERIVVTGNTLAGALDAILPGPAERAAILADLDLRARDFTLATIHRAHNADNPQILAALAGALGQLATRTTVVLPLHPRTAHNLDAWGLRELLGATRVVDPLSPRQFVALEAHAQLLLSDSGGVQEEACLLRTPLLVLRDSTERPELLDGWCRLLGDDDPRSAVQRAWQDHRGWAAELADRPLPYPTADASQLIVEEMVRRWPAVGERTVAA